MLKKETKFDPIVKARGGGVEGLKSRHPTHFLPLCKPQAPDPTTVNNINIHNTYQQISQQQKHPISRISLTQSLKIGSTSNTIKTFRRFRAKLLQICECCRFGFIFFILLQLSQQSRDLIYPYLFFITYSHNAICISN